MSNLLKYFIALFITCVGIALLWYCYTPPKTQPEAIPEGVRISGSETQPEIIPKRVPEKTSGPKTQPEAIPETKFSLEKFVFGKPLEKVDLEYKRNIHFSVKTSSKNYRVRLSLLLLTWFQVVDCNEKIGPPPKPVPPDQF